MATQRSIPDLTKTHQLSQSFFSVFRCQNELALRDFEIDELALQHLSEQYSPHRIKRSWFLIRWEACYFAFWCITANLAIWMNFCPLKTLVASINSLADTKCLTTASLGSE